MTNPTNNTGTLPEAPASASAKMVSPKGIEWTITARDFTVNGLLKKIEVMETHLLKDGWQPADHSQPAPTSSTVSVGAAVTPVCPDGHGAMKPSTKKPGEFYCPAVVGTHPQTGKSLYCAHKVG